MDILRGWNERSFPGWSAWALRIAAVGTAVAMFQALLFPGTPFSLYLAGVWVLGLAAASLAIARIVAWAAGISPLAVLAGLSRWAPAVLFIPAVDRLGLAFGAVPPVWWTAPGGAWSRIALAGYAGGGWGSLGLAAGSVVLAGALGWLARRFGAKPARAVTAAVATYLLVWMAVLVPSVTVWSRLSAYGATLAAPDRVVRQAFIRAWGKTLWLSERDRFWTMPPVSEQGALVVVGGALLWLACFALAAPYLPRSERNGFVWERRFREASAFAPALLLGGLVGVGPVVVPAAWLPWAVQGLFSVAVFLVAGKAAVSLANGAADPERSGALIGFGLLGAWWLGWPVAAALGAALAFAVARPGEPWRSGAARSAVSAWFFSLAAWSVMSRLDWSAFPRPVFLGAFLFLLACAVWRMAGARILAGETVGGLVSERFGPSLTKPVLLGIFAAGMASLWLASGVLALGWAVGSLVGIAAALLWLFPRAERYLPFLLWFSAILLGLAWHGA